MPSDSVELVVLIVSTGRTGTKAIAQHLSRCCDTVRAVHEPPPTRFRLRRAANRFLCGRTSKTKLVDILSWHRDRMLGGTSQAVYVESNPALSGFLDAFGEVFENFRVLHVVRNPTTYVVSSINWGVFRGVKKLMAGYLPYWLPKPELSKAAAAPARLSARGKAWARMSDPERLAWHWSMINRHLDRGAELYGDRYLRLRYEDMFARDGAGLARLLEWLGLPPSEALLTEANRENVNASRDHGFPRFRDWTAENQHMLLDYCGDLMAAYGYPLPDAALVTPSPA